MNKDLTNGAPQSVLWRFCMPLFGSVIFQQLYNIADSLIAGKFINEDALAAVGNSYEITLIFIAIAFGCNIGCSVLTSRFFGARDHVQLRSTVTTSFLASGLACVVLMLSGFLLGDSLLRLIQTPEHLLSASLLYLNIYLLGLPFVFFYNLATGIFTAFGDSKTPFLFLMASSLSNIVMDYCFVVYLKMEIAGIAWATFICQGVSCILSLLVVLKKLHALKSTTRAPLFSGSILRQFLVIAIPSALQQGFVSVGNIILQGIINSFGPPVMAGYAAAIKLNNLVITAFTTLGNGISNYTSQNLGAAKPKRIPEGFKAGIRLVLMLSIPLALLYSLIPETLLRFFIDQPSDEALHTGIMLLRIVSPFYCVISLKLVSDGILRGARLMLPFMICTFTDLILRVALAFALSATPLGATGIWCAWPLGWVVGTVMSLLFYRKHVRRMLAKQPEAADA